MEYLFWKIDEQESQPTLWKGCRGKEVVQDKEELSREEQELSQEGDELSWELLSRVVGTSRVEWFLKEEGVTIRRVEWFLKERSVAVRKEGSNSLRII